MRILPIVTLVLGLVLGAQGAGAEEPARASEIIDAQVENGAGEPLGRIEGLLLDTRPSGQHFAILARDDGKRFGYPVNAFRRGAGQRLVLHVPERNLEIAPGYADVRDAFQPDGAKRFVRARNVLGQPIQDALGARAGVVRDVALSLETARTQWVLVDFGDGQVLPMPGHDVRLSPDGPATLHPDSYRRS